MGIIVVSGAAVSVAANTKSADQVTGQYQNIGRGVLSLWAKPSATGMLYSLRVNGVALIDDQPVVTFGAAGSLSKVDNLILQQQVNGGRVELFLRNSTAGALTNDYILEFTPTK
jgi:hypothetical protein